MRLTATAGKPASIEKTLAKRTYALFLLCSVAAVALLTWFTLVHFERILLPQVLAKSDVIASSVRTTIEEATGLGIPYDSLVGVEDFLSDTLIENPEIAFIKVQREGMREYVKARSGSAGAANQEVVLRQIDAAGDAPRVIVAVRASYIQEKLQVMVGDALVVSVVALIAGLEIALFFMVRWIMRPIDTWRAMIGGMQSGQLDRELKQPEYGPFSELLRLSNDKITTLRKRFSGGTPSTDGRGGWYQPQARDVRMALFLFVLSEELLRSFLTLYVKEFADPSNRLNTELAISAPIIAYMFVAGVGTLFGSGLVDRLGLRRAFGLSVIVSTVSLCGLAAAHSVTEIVVWRSVSAFGYAVATIACQVFIARTGTAGGANVRALSIFVAAVTAACICGAPIGAVLADMLGKPAALLFAALMAVLSWVFFSKITMPPAPAGNAGDGPEQGMAGFGALLRCRAVLTAMVCGVLPGKLMMAGMLFYITPLLLQQYQLSQASIGQFFILYYVLLSLGNAVISRADPKLRTKTMLVIAGAVTSGAGGLIMIWFNTPLALALVIVCFGLGQSILLTPLTTVILDIAARELPDVSPSRALALARAFERVGGITGAVLAAVLSAALGYRSATALLGIIVLTLGLGTVSLLRPVRSRGFVHG